MAANRKKAGGLREGRRRYVPNGMSQSVTVMQTAKLFKNGRSQAVRLPKEFRFEGDEVYLKREGNSVVLIPKGETKENPWKDFFEALDSFDPAIPLERKQPTEQQVRKSLDEMFPPRRKRTKKAE
jgi:antitoxin VapB